MDCNQVSLLDKYDFSCIIESLIRDNKLEIFKEFIKSNESINNFFDYEYTDNGKIHYLSFIIKQKFLMIFIQI